MNLGQYFFTTPFTTPLKTKKARNQKITSLNCTRGGT